MEIKLFHLLSTHLDSPHAKIYLQCYKAIVDNLQKMSTVCPNWRAWLWVTENNFANPTKPEEFLLKTIRTHKAKCGECNPKKFRVENIQRIDIPHPARFQNSFVNPFGSRRRWAKKHDKHYIRFQLCQHLNQHSVRDEVWRGMVVVTWWRYMPTLIDTFQMLIASKLYLQKKKMCHERMIVFRDENSDNYK